MLSSPRGLIIVGLLLMLLGVSGCAPQYMRVVEGSGLARPPAGKSLVNFVRPTGYGKGDQYMVWDTHELIGNTKGKCRFQYVCEPGEHVFIGRTFNSASVVRANVASDNVYDIVINVKPGMFGASITMEPISVNHPKRGEVASWEDRATLYELDPTANTDGLEQSQRGAIDRVLQDFVNGEKSDRLQNLGAGDARQ